MLREVNHCSGIVYLIPAAGDQCWVGGKGGFEESQPHSGCSRKVVGGCFSSYTALFSCLSMDY